MGRKFEEVQDEAKRVPYKIVKASNGDAHVEVAVGGASGISRIHVAGITTDLWTPTKFLSKRPG